jgi:protein-tyrosine phosphatase
MPDRHLAWSACHNARDVGGYPTADGREVRWRGLVRADNLCRLTAEGQAALREYGVRTVVDLRRASEVRAEPHPFDGSDRPGYVHLDLDEATPELLAIAPDKYYPRVLDVRAPSVAAAVAAFAGAPPGGVLFHCQSGKDRTGIVVALLLALAGVRRETIVADYLLSDDLLAPDREARMRAASADPVEQAALTDSWRARPEKINGLLDRLEALGGAEAYLRSAGLSADDLDRVRARLR